MHNITADMKPLVFNLKHKNNANEQYALKQEVIGTASTPSHKNESLQSCCRRTSAASSEEAPPWLAGSVLKLCSFREWSGGGVSPNCTPFHFPS